MFFSSPDYGELIDSLPQIVWSSPPNDWPDYFNRRWFEYTGLVPEGQRAEDSGQRTEDGTEGSGFRVQGGYPALRAIEGGVPASSIQHPVSSIQYPRHPSSIIHHPAASKPGWYAVVHADDLPGFVAEWETALRAGAPFGLMVRLRRAADGAFRWHLTRGNPMRDAAGRIRRWVGTFSDVGDRVEAEESLKRSAAELARSNAELKEFASAASHDLQEPPRQIASVIQLLLEHPEKLNAETAKWLGVAYSGAKRMQRLMNGLVDYARLGTKLKPFAVIESQVAYELAVNEINSKIKETGALLTHTPMPRVAGDESALARLFKNLLDNALTFRSTEPPRVQILVEKLGKEWRFEIRDNGIGIPPNCFRRLFILFQRFHSPADESRIGLGLAVSKKIVELHHGRIWAEAREGGGTSFFFTLPAVP
ncbi:MAG: hypothetical protein C5B50_28515 [Verrucomicrobia bacterium]|nr:MAG: hypothetical protein C5B50_28515 [Verrucomicrobiota bacterium]